MKNFEIKKYLQENPVVTAPMAGVTDKAFRIIARRFGAGLIYSEMVSAKAVCYKNKKTYELFDLKDEVNPLVIQLFGSEPEVMAEAAAFVEASQKPAAIDINMGCPVPKVVKNAEGSALMREPELAQAIVREMKKKIKTPLSVKFRSGWDETSLNYLDFAKRMEAAGVDFMAVHPRTRTQLYSGKSDWSVIGQIREAVRVPVIGSGDVYSARDFAAMREATGCQGVMLGRGLLGNFHLIEEIHAHLGNKEYEGPGAYDKLGLLEEHLDLLIEYKGESIATKEIRKFFAWYSKNLPGATRLRTEVNSIKSSAEFKAFLNRIYEDDYFAERKMGAD